jgi:hypothetical protein
MHTPQLLCIETDRLPPFLSSASTSPSHLPAEVHVLFEAEDGDLSLSKTGDGRFIVLEIKGQVGVRGEGGKSHLPMRVTQCK